jgi:toxin ParE1/3/4
LKPNIILRPRVRDDLDGHAEYLMVNERLEIAAHFLDAVKDSFASLAKRPFAGAPSEHLPSSGLVSRFLQVAGFRKHLIFYRPLENGIDVLRVVHEARDLKSVLGESGDDN